MIQNRKSVEISARKKGSKSMKNRKLLLVLSLLLALTVSLTGTLAYLTDTDSDVNVMTLGNVKIEQLENGQSESGFIQNQPLYPAYYGDNWKADDVTGAIEKRVNVRNTGKSDAYVRTVFAFEAGELTKAEFDQYIHLLWNGVTPEWEPEKVTIKGEQYFLAWYVYPDKIPAGQLAGETLQRVVMDKTADSTVVSKLGDSDYNILVVTQAVQTANFDALGTAGALNEAFGTLSETSHPWLDWNGMGDDNGDQDPDEYIVVTTPQELKDAMLIYDAKILLGKDIIVTKDTPRLWSNYMFVANGRNVTIDLNGKNIIVEKDAFERANALFTTANKGVLNIVGEGTVEVKNTQAGIFHAMNPNTQINVYGGTYISNSDNGADALATIYTNTGNVDVYGGKFYFPEGVPCANAEDRQGDKLFTVFHEGTLLQHPTYQMGDSTRVKLEVGCELQEVVIDGATWYKVVRTVPADVTIVQTADELTAALAEGGKIMLLNDITLNAAQTAPEKVTIDLNNNTLSTVGLDFAKGGKMANGKIQSNGNTSMVPHVKVSGGEMIMDNIQIAVDDYLNYQAQGNKTYGEYSGIEIANATATLNNCEITVSNDTYRTWNYVYGLTVNNANVTVNSGKITIISAGGSITDLQTAVCAIGSCTVTLNQVDVSAKTLGTTMGHLVLNTTDASVTDADFTSYVDGTYQLNIIQ